jgi:predicted lipoprotein with Yx(FWY)xxD motif
MESLQNHFAKGGILNMFTRNKLHSIRPYGLFVSMLVAAVVLAACQSAAAQSVSTQAPVVSEAPAATTSQPIVLLGGNATLGKFLTDANGKTLYVFTKDNAGDSTCYDQCAANWPALTVTSDQNLIAGDGVTGKLATITRTDGSLQVTYNGWPLYYFVKDTAAGDTNGQGVNNVWFVAPESGNPVAPVTQSSSSSQNSSPTPVGKSYSGNSYYKP